MRKIHFLMLLLPFSIALTGCANGPRATDALPEEASARTVALAQMDDGLDGVVDRARAGQPSSRASIATVQPLITGLGLAQVSRQPGGSLNEKRLLAIRAARLDAIRDLTEQVHGIRVSADTSVHDTVVRNDRLRALVSGEIRGARTDRITPKGSDSYEVVLSLDADVVAYILRAAALGV
ncbi:MAG: LPP20 family lipoprotein [Pseudomonadota bacterium]